MNARIRVGNNMQFFVFKIYNARMMIVGEVCAESESEALWFAVQTHGSGCMVQRADWRDQEEFMFRLRQQDRKQEAEYFRMRDTEKAESQGFRRGISSKNWSH